MNWQDCLENKIVNRTIKNLELARSLYKTAKDRKGFIESVPFTKRNVRFITEAYYETLIELVHSLLSINGFKSYNHECSIEFLSEFYSKEFDKNEIKFIHRLRMLRNIIKYEGKELNKKDARYWIGKSKIIIKKLLNILKKEFSI